MFRKICRRNSIVFLALLSSLLLLLFTHLHILIPHYNTPSVKEDNPVINHNRELETVRERLVSIATMNSDWNVSKSEERGGGRGGGGGLNQPERLRNRTTGVSSHGTDNSTNRETEKETIRGGGGGHKKRDGERRPPVIWRGGDFGAEARKLRQLFPLPKNFSFPNPQITLSLSEIDRSQWMMSLRKLLATRSRSKVINLVSSNSQYQDVLLNWLISAVVRSELELNTILVISMDLSLHLRLSIKGIPSISVPLFKLIKKDTNFTKPFDQVMMLRLAVIRLLSFWKFDVYNYDTDAVLLKDPQPLYDQFPDTHIIGSVGRIPFDLMEKWGITVCIGVVIVRSSPFVEEYWQSVAKSCPSSLDDQQKLNCGLDGLNIIWDNPNSDQNTTVVTGRCSNGLEVKVLPYRAICRLETCDPALRESLYVWHKGGQRTRREKVKGSRAGRTWFLQYKWNKIKNELRGKEWLESIAYWQVTHT